jgi:hypothetical protein
MKVAFVLIAFNSDYVLEPCLKSVLPFGNVYAAEGPVTFWQKRGYTTSTDQTNAILDKYKIPTEHYTWKEKDDEQNAAIALVPPDTDFVWCLDSDEIWKAQDIEAILRILETNTVDSVSFKAWSFYGGFDRYMTGFEENFEVHRIQRFYPGARFATHRPPTILAPDGKPWREYRHMNHIKTDEIGVRFYHYSYVFPSQMEAKALYYAEMGGNIPDYFDRVYLPWALGDSESRYEIEERYDGVHNWLPDRRGPCRTAQFKGEHPAEIQKVMPQLQRRLRLELGL